MEKFFQLFFKDMCADEKFLVLLYLRISVLPPYLKDISKDILKELWVQSYFLHLKNAVLLPPDSMVSNETYFVK